jgi:filamentous hemagglutinin
MVREMKRRNMEANGGLLRDDVTGEIMDPSAKSQRGITPPSNEVQVDHVVPIDQGGTRAMNNLLLRTRSNNRAKWNN